MLSKLGPPTKDNADSAPQKSPMKTADTPTIPSSFLRFMPFPQKKLGSADNP
jgi:hypothetical protein